jgi:hypothetical protein
LGSKQQVCGEVGARVVGIHLHFNDLQLLILARLPLLRTSRPRSISFRFLLSVRAAVFLVAGVAPFCNTDFPLEFNDHILPKHLTNFLDDSAFSLLKLFDL